MKIISLALALFLSFTLVAQVDTSKVYTVVQQMPEFPGGQDSMNRYLATHTHYPEQASDSAIQGRVVIGYVVNRDGSISNVDVKRHVHPLLDAEAMRVVRSFPRQHLGMQGGQAVKVSMVVPVTFKIALEPEFVLPVFPGGEQAMKEYLRANIKHKDGARGFLGLVPVAFTIDTGGNISDAHCSLSVPGDIDSEAVRVVMSMPRFQPAKQKGHTEPSQLMLNVSFFDERYVVDAEGNYNGTALDEWPSFPGGYPAQRAFFEKYLSAFYSLRDKMKGLIVEFTSLPDSSISGITITSGITDVTDAQLKAVIARIGKFKPGIYNGKPVKTRVRYVIDTFSRIAANPIFSAMPRFPGGLDSLRNFVQSQVRYPELERENGIQARVVVRFKVEEDGRTNEIVVDKGNHRALDMEAARVVSILPNFIPGTLQGIPVSVPFIFPVAFILK
ncbi:MAG: TonB family protein [Bacteroidetes bacterium]|nr:TonB family protein [Bacteroidota bacterium]